MGRVANRIAKGTFKLEGREYKLAINNGPNALHGGKRGFDKVIWEGAPISHPEGDAVRLTYTSKDGEEVRRHHCVILCTHWSTIGQDMPTDLQVQRNAVICAGLPWHAHRHSDLHHDSRRHAEGHF